MAEYVQWTGKTDVLLAEPPTQLGGNPGTLAKLGEAQDMIDPVEQYYYNDVPGDRHGGPQGPPIERQVLGMAVTINLDMSRWDPAQLTIIKKHDVFATAGKIDLAEVGTLLFLRNAFRLVLSNSKLDDDGVLQTEGYSFPCAVLAAPIRQPRGTKFTTLSLTFEAHRAPEGTWKEGVVWDNDLTEPA